VQLQRSSRMWTMRRLYSATLAVIPANSMEKPILRSSSKPEMPKSKPGELLRPQSALQQPKLPRNSWYGSYLRALSHKPAQHVVSAPSKSSTLRPSPMSPLVHKPRIQTPLRLQPIDPRLRALSALTDTQKSTPKPADYLSDYHVGVIIGQGSFASVRRAVQKTTTTSVAIKTYEKYRLLDALQKTAVAREIKILSQLNHDNVVRLLKVIDTPKQLHLVLEEVKGQSVLNWMKQREGRRLPEPEAKAVFRQVVAALEYLHSRGVAHRDIKLQNVLITEDLHVCLIDFGCATEGALESKSGTYCGTLHYMAPEILQRRGFKAAAADMWAAGVMLYCMLSGDFPFKAANDRSLRLKIQAGAVLFPAYVSEEAKRCISALLSLDPDSRPSAKAIMNHPWLTTSRNQVADEGLRPATTPMLLYQRGNAFGGTSCEPEASFKRLLEIRSAKK